MKRIIVFWILILSLITNNLFAYTTSDNMSTKFNLELNKSGVNRIYFAESAALNDDKTISATSISNNRHIFPLLTNDSELSDELYFVWELGDSTGATINLKFVSSDTDFNTGYMLQNVNNIYSSDSEKSNDFNYYVSICDPSLSKKGEIEVTNASVLTQMDISQRTIKVFEGKDLSTSYVKIDMKVLAPVWEDGTQAFMDAQYAGYIVAELKFTN